MARNLTLLTMSEKEGRMKKKMSCLLWIYRLNIAIEFSEKKEKKKIYNSSDSRGPVQGRFFEASKTHQQNANTRPEVKITHNETNHQP